MITTVISFFAALRAGETGARVIGIVILMALGVLGAGYMLHRHDQRVAAEALAKIERANMANETVADAKQREIMACPPGRWDRDADKCKD
jgi:hypothetical protein